MKWEMEMEEIEAVLEKIWDLHDKISDAIHAISRTHFLKSIRTLGKPSTEKKHPPAPVFGGGGGGGGGGVVGDEGSGGFVFVKAFRAEEDDAAISEARSLNAIRTALENLEDQLEFFHTVQSQQRAERDAAIARLEQSRIILAMKLADHHGKKYKVIEEALAFVGDVRDSGHFVAPENIFGVQRETGETLEDGEGKRSNVLMRLLISSMNLAKNSLKLDRFGSIIGNAALFAVSMLAMLKLHQVASKGDFALESPLVGKHTFYTSRDENRDSPAEGSSQGNQVKHLDVLLARG